MSSLPAETNRISVEDYLTGEKDGEVRHEYVGGEDYAMTGASARHGLLVTACAAHTAAFPAGGSPALGVVCSPR